MGVMDVRRELGKAAQIENAKERRAGWPGVWRGLAMIIEAGPDKAAGQVLTFSDRPPRVPMGCAPRGCLGVERADYVARRIAFIGTAGHECRGVLRGGEAKVRVRFMEAVVKFDLVIKSHDIDRLGNIDRAEEAAIHSCCYWAGGIESLYHRD